MADAIEVRVSALEEDVSQLRDLVDGQEPWSHRKRLHKLEDDEHAATLVQQAIDTLRSAQSVRRRSRWDRIREWGVFAVAVAAVLISTHPWS
jgi:hypothetical protein